MSIKLELGNYKAEELQKYIAKELEENALKTNDQRLKFMEFLGSFSSSRYSAGNQLLLYIQASREQYTKVFGTFDEWRDKGTSIKKGEKAMTICRPIFTDTYVEKLLGEGHTYETRHFKYMLPKKEIERLELAVKAGRARKEYLLSSFTFIDSAFSISQTTMEESDKIEYLQRYNAKNTSEENVDLYKKLVNISEAIGRKVEERDFQNSSIGWVERYEGINILPDAPEDARIQIRAKTQEIVLLEGKRGKLSNEEYKLKIAKIENKYKRFSKWTEGAKIVIKKDMPIDSKVSVLAHEIGHKILHIQNYDGGSKSQHEVQAQLFSHLAMLKLGIDAEKQFSLSYINGWLNQGEKNTPMLDKEGKVLSRGETLQLNLMTVIPAVDALMQTVGEKMQPIDKESLKNLQNYKIGTKIDKKPIERVKENKIEIEPLQIYKETDKAVMIKIEGEKLGEKRSAWLPKSQVSTNKEGFVHEATPSLIKSKGLTALTNMMMTQKVILKR